MDKKKVVSMLDKAIEWSLYMMLFCLPFSKTILEIAITVALFAWITKKILLKDFRLKKTPLNILLFAFFAACSVSIINSDNKFLTFYAVITKCLKWIILYFIIMEEIVSEVKLKNLLKIALLSGVIIAADAYIQWYLTHVDLLRGYPAFKYLSPLTWNGPFRGFPTGSFPFPNDFSAWILVLLIPALAMLIYGFAGIYARFGLGFFSIGLLHLLFLANTRGAWLGFAASLALIINLKKIKFLLIFFLLILAILPFLPKQKINDIFGTSSSRDRISMWRTGWDIFLEHPIIGNGMNTFFGKFMEFREDEARGKMGSYAHNGFLQIAADTGIIGLTVFLALILRVFHGAFRFIRSCEDRFYRPLALGLSGGLLAFLVHSFFDTNLQSLPLVALFWFNVAILMNTPNICAKSTGKSWS